MGYTPNFLKDLHRDASRDVQLLLEQQHPELRPAPPPEVTAKPRKSPPPAPLPSRTVESMLIEITIPIVVTTVANAKGFWWGRNKTARAQQAIVLQYVEPLAPLLRRCLPIDVTMTRVSSRGRLMDDDNLTGAFKHVRDQIARCIGIDDADPRIKFTTQQIRGPNGCVVRFNSRP